DNGDVLVIAQKVASFVGRIGRQNVQLLAVEDVIVEGVAGPVMNRGIVVDDGDLPWHSMRRRDQRLLVLDQRQEVVVVGHRSIRSPRTLSSFGVLARGGQGKRYAKGGAAPGSRRDHDSASEATGHQVVNNMQAEASAPLAAPGREEGVERPA